jgi:hypothetical protein
MRSLPGIGRILHPGFSRFAEPGVTADAVTRFGFEQRGFGGSHMLG